MSFLFDNQFHDGNPFWDNDTDRGAVANQFGSLVESAAETAWDVAKDKFKQATDYDRVEADVKGAIDKLKKIKQKGLDGIGAHLRRPDPSGSAPPNSPMDSETAMTPSGSVSNFPVSTQMSGKRQGTDGDEVPVMPPPKRISKMHPDYFTITLPYMTKQYTSLEPQIAYNYAAPFCVIRLNSIYDPLKGKGFTGAAILKDDDSQPQGREIWASHFKFYRVLKTYVKLTFINSRYRNEASDVFRDSYAVGYELVDEDAAISNNADMFMMTKRAKRAILGPAPSTTTYNGVAVFRESNGMSSTTMEYVYTPDNWNFHVEELGSEERWTPINQNPAIDHDMAIRILHMSNSLPEPTGQGNGIGVLVQLSFEVQFREPVDAFYKTLNVQTATYGGTDENADDD
jgi:hypothetical protein